MTEEDRGRVWGISHFLGERSLRSRTTKAAVLQARARILVTGEPALHSWMPSQACGHGAQADRALALSPVTGLVPCSGAAPLKGKLSVICTSESCVYGPPGRGHGPGAVSSSLQMSAQACLP